MYAITIAFGSNKATLSPKRILNVESSYLPKCTELFKRLFRKQEPVSNFRRIRFLYRGGLTGTF